MSLTSLAAEGGTGGRLGRMEHNLAVLDHEAPEEADALRRVLADRTFTSREIREAMQETADDHPRMAPLSERSIAHYRQNNY